jgi:hypothetical protein
VTLPEPRPTSPNPAPAGQQAVCNGCDQRPATHESLTCQRCRQRLVDLLDEIARGFPRLDPTPGAAGITGAPGAPGFGSKSPARDDVLVLTDRRRQAHDPEQPRNASSLLRTVAHWADTLRVDGLLDRLDGPRTVAGECEALASAAGTLGRRWWFGDMLANLEAAAQHMRRALDEVEPTIPLGRCPRPAREAAAAYEVLVADVGEVLAARVSRAPRCGGEVRARVFGATARCRRCGWRWEGEPELRRLGAQLGDAMLDLPALARYLGVDSLATLRSWAHRDGWDRVKVGRRTMYRLADARDSWWRALARRQTSVGRGSASETL